MVFNVRSKAIVDGSGVIKYFEKLEKEIGNVFFVF